jgi:signal transduction histidine kinase
MSLHHTLQAQPKPVISALALVLIAVIGWMDYNTGGEISLGVFYALPIILVVWYLGRLPGIVTAAVCTLMWAWSNKFGNPFLADLTKGAFIWAAFSRLVYFTCIAIAGAAIRKQREFDKTRIAALEHARALERDIVNVSEREQRRIGQDLHDGLCQVLAGIGCAASMLKDELRAKSLPEAGAAEEIENYIQDAATEARDLARGIFPVLHDPTGLESALEELAALTSKLHHRHVQADCEDGISFTDPDVSMHLYRIAQEAVGNALKHAKAENVSISLRRVDGHVRLEVHDDGRGLPPDAFSTSTGMGLRTMKYRAGLIGAHLDITPEPGGGTVVCCNMRANGAPG